VHDCLVIKYDPISSALNWGIKSELKLTYQDVNLVMGIPWEGKDIISATHQELVIMKKYIC
jgi:hypothetical protein